MKTSGKNRKHCKDLGKNSPGGLLEGQESGQHTLAFATDNIGFAVGHTPTLPVSQIDLLEVVSVPMADAHERVCSHAVGLLVTRPTESAAPPDTRMSAKDKKAASAWISGSSLHAAHR